MAWIAQRAASLSRVSWELKVSLSARRLTVLNAGRVVERYTVAIGMPDAPTPTGRFAVTDRLLTGDPSRSVRLLHPRALGERAARDSGVDGRDADRDPLDP